MLEFTHLTDDCSGFHWPFVYLHGKAESDNNEAFSAGGPAPDLCDANEPISLYWKGETVAIECLANGKPAVCVLSERSGYVSGRISYKDDFLPLMHCLAPHKWC